MTGRPSLYKVQLILNSSGFNLMCAKLSTALSKCADPWIRPLPRVPGQTAMPGRLDSAVPRARAQEVRAGEGEEGRRRREEGTGVDLGSAEGRVQPEQLLRKEAT